MEIYRVIHDYDIDGGFGDAVSKQEIVTSFFNEEDAHAFIEKYEKPHVYDVPYSSLECGMLSVRAVQVYNSIEEFETENSTDFWWLNNRVIEDNEEDDDEEDNIDA